MFERLNKTVEFIFVLEIYDITNTIYFIFNQILSYYVSYFNILVRKLQLENIIIIQSIK